MKNTPKLRFPEFLDEGEWEEVKLEKLGKLVSGLTYSPDDVRDNGLLVLRSSNVQNGEIKLEDNVYVRKDIRGANLTEPNDILICVRNGSKALIGKNALIPNNMPLCTHGAFMTIFRAKSPKFIYQLFQTNEYERQVNADLGATINSINGKQFLKYEFNIPTEKEQQKIADCLSSVDNLITAGSKKVQTLKEHKKALMQQLFPSEGEEVPKLRFPEFKNAPKWEEKKLENIADFFKGKNISKADIHEEGITPCIRYGELYTHYQEVIDKIFSKTNLPTSNLFLSCKNDVIIPSSGETKIDIATASCVSHDGIALGGDINIIRSEQNGIFISYYLNSAKKMDIAKIAQGDTVVHLYSSQLKKLDILLPPTQEEQQKIANFLSSIDELITASTKKVETLKEHKKALMQQLFPSKEVQI